MTAYEPFKPDLEMDDIPLAHSIEQVMAEANAVVLMVAHTQFCNLDPRQLATLMPGRIAIDVVGGWDPKSWAEAGYQLTRLGVGKSH